jgi:hypothetical protein
LRNKPAKGQKSYWGGFHWDVTVNLEPALNPAKIGVRASFASMLSGSEPNVYNDCNFGQDRRNDEGRTLRHSGFLARHRLRMV